MTSLVRPLHESSGAIRVPPSGEVFRDEFLQSAGLWASSVWQDNGGPNGGPCVSAAVEAVRTWVTMPLHQAYYWTAWVKGNFSVSYGPQIKEHADWAPLSWTTRMPYNVSIANAWFTPAVLATLGGGGFFLADIAARAITSSELAQYSDEVMENRIGANVRAFADASRLALLPRTMDLLENGPSINVLCFGDSWQGSQAHAPFAELLQRAYPNCSVAPYLVNANQHGMNDWATKMPDAIQAVSDWCSVTPDLIYCGGISDSGDAGSWHTVLEAFRAEYPNAEYIAGGIANGVSEETTSAAIEEIAEDEGIAYYPAGEVMNNLLADADRTLPSLCPDGTHVDPSAGGHILGQGFAAFLGATPTEF